MNNARNMSAHLPMFVLDVLRYDIEQISNIVTLLNNDGGVGWRDVWGREFTATDVIAILPELVQKRYVQVLWQPNNHSDLVEARGPFDFENDSGRLWFRMTASGRQAWKKWDDVPSAVPLRTFDGANEGGARRQTNRYVRCQAAMPNKLATK